MEGKREESRDRERERERVASLSRGTDTFEESGRKRNAAVLLRQLRRARRTPYRAPMA